jgi:protein-disulfide isomerase
MTSRVFKYSILPAAALAAVSFASGALADKPLTKADVEKIMHDYIVEHPQEIMDSVNTYQTKAVQTREAEGLKKNKDILLRDSTSPDAGNPKGDVTVVEFFDYNCHYCKGALPAIQSLLEKDKNVHFIFRDFPILGPSSDQASRWALAAQKQKKYYEFYKAMMNNKSPIDEDMLAGLAKEVGMDVEQARKDAASSATSLQLERNRTLAGELGISGTPAFIIGDQIIRGAVPLEDMEHVIADERRGGTAKN